MQPLNPPKNDCVSRARASSRKLVEAPESALSAKSGSSHHSNSTDEGRENRRRSLKSANPRRSGMLGRAKSMRQARSSTRKERSASFDLGDDNDRDHDHGELHDNNSKHSNNSSSKDKHRRSSKSSKDLLSSKSNHSSASSSASKRKKGFKKHDPLSSQSSHAAFHRRDYDDDSDNHDGNVLFSQTSQEPVHRDGRPIMTRRASLSNIKSTFGSKSKRFLGSSSNSNSKQHDKEQQNARPALTSQYSIRIMSKPVATGPYEGIALIECDVTVHGGAELAAKNRQFHLGKRASSNPFVEVWQNLPSQMVGKTKTVTKTLQPTYDESFKITWTEKALSRCLSKSHQAKIMLKIWDADRISGAEAMGEVSILVPLPNDCPTVSRQWFLVDKDSARNASGRLLVSLNVRHVRTKQEEEEEEKEEKEEKEEEEFESDNESF